MSAHEPRGKPDISLSYEDESTNRRAVRKEDALTEKQKSWPTGCASLGAERQPVEAHASQPSLIQTAEWLI